VIRGPDATWGSRSHRRESLVIGASGRHCDHPEFHRIHAFHPDAFCKVEQRGAGTGQALGSSVRPADLDADQVVYVGGAG
jgi:hypothetical protein